MIMSPDGRRQSPTEIDWAASLVGALPPTVTVTVSIDRLPLACRDDQFTAPRG